MTAFHDLAHATLGNTTAGIVTVLLAVSVSLSARAAEPQFRIGVIQSESVVVFERVQKGFADAMANSGFTERVNVSYDIQTTGSSALKEREIARKFAAAGIALIHSIGTRPTQAMIRESSIPVVFSAVTDPMGAGIVPITSPPETPTGTNVTGVSDATPIRVQLEVFSRLAPKARKWGAIYNPAEPNSVFIMEELRRSARHLQFELIEVTVASGDEVPDAVAALAGKGVEALFKPADSTVSASFKALVAGCDARQIALFTGGNGATRGALASYGVDHYLVGYAAGKKAALILKGNKAGTIPWGNVDKFDLVINLRAAKAQGITVPAEMLRLADRVIP